MPLTERELRTRDIGRPEPAPAVLDRLEATGHARNGFCEKCWAAAGGRSITEPSKTQADAYLDVLAEAEATNTAKEIS